MKRLLMPLTLAVALLLVLFTIAVARTGAFAAVLAPLVVTISQQVPVEILVTTSLEDGAILTTTVPITLGIDLAITVAGAQIVSAAAAETVASVSAAPAVAPDDHALVDNNDIPYTIEAPAGLVVTQLRTAPDRAGDFSLLGEIRNDTDGSLEFVKVTLTAYAVDGPLLDADFTYADLDTIAPGQRSVFDESLDVPFADVGSYRIQIQP